MALHFWPIFRTSPRTLINYLETIESGTYHQTASLGRYKRWILVQINLIPGDAVRSFSSQMKASQRDSPASACTKSIVKSFCCWTQQHMFTLIEWINKVGQMSSKMSESAKDSKVFLIFKTGEGQHLTHSNNWHFLITKLFITVKICSHQALFTVFPL